MVFATSIGVAHLTGNQSESCQMKRLAVVTVVVSFVVAAAAGCIPMHPRDSQAEARHVQRLCNEPSFAYESGYNAGLQRRQLDTSWADTGCIPEQRQAARDSYQTGFHNGIQNAPIVVQQRGGAASSGERCSFSSDCGEGRTCRSNQCMGEGYAGDACWFSSDCLSGSCNGAQKTCN
jgi:hypothetical protein